VTRREDEWRSVKFPPPATKKRRFIQKNLKRLKGCCEVVKTNQSRELTNPRAILKSHLYLVVWAVNVCMFLWSDLNAKFLTLVVSQRNISQLPKDCQLQFIKMFCSLVIEMAFRAWGLYYKNIKIANDNSRVVRMILQIVASPRIVIWATLEVSFTILENIYNRGITHDDCHMTIKIFLQFRPLIYVSLRYGNPPKFNLL
jgi:hypothetical protein